MNRVPGVGRRESCGAAPAEGAVTLVGGEVERKHAPRSAIAGFILGIIGLLLAAIGVVTAGAGGILLDVPDLIFFIAWVAGLVMSLIGYTRAKREALPSRLALVGTIIGVAFIMPVGFLLLAFLLFAFGGA